MRSFSVFCFSISSSSVRSLISSSRLDEYCSSMRSMESMMLVFLPLLMFLNWGRAVCRGGRGGGEEDEEEEEEGEGEEVSRRKIKG